MIFSTLSINDLKEDMIAAFKAENISKGDKYLAQIVAMVITTGNVSVPDQESKCTLIPQDGIFEPDEKGNVVIFSARLAKSGNVEKPGRTGSFKPYMMPPMKRNGTPGQPSSNGNSQPSTPEVPGDENGKEDQPPF